MRHIDLSAAHFHDETAAFAELDSLIWPHGPVCPHCGSKERIYKLQGVRTKPSKKNPEAVERPGLRKCGQCRKQFAVRAGTVFESIHIPLHKWFQAVHLMCSSKKDISSHQPHRTLEINYEAAWFMSHRFREAMRSSGLGQMGGGGGIVEIDETYIGYKGNKDQTRKGDAHRNAVLTLISREGDARSFHIDESNKENILPIIRANLAAETKVVTDDAGFYRNLDNEFMHAFVNHSAGQYGRGEIHTNTIEGIYSIFKRGIKGVYQHCSEKHLHRYLAEFDFCYSNRKALGIEDKNRAVNAMRGAKGKRLSHRTANK